MPAFLYRCPTTGQNVQGFTAEEVGGDTYEAITCRLPTTPFCRIQQPGKFSGRMTTNRPPQWATVEKALAIVDLRNDVAKRMTHRLQVELASRVRMGLVVGVHAARPQATIR